MDLGLHSRLAVSEQMHRDNKSTMECLWNVEETDMPGEKGVCQEAEENKASQVGCGPLSRF